MNVERQGGELAKGLEELFNHHDIKNKFNFKYAHINEFQPGKATATSAIRLAPIPIDSLFHSSRFRASELPRRRD